jgi:Zn-dependent peptidase ImmA (M78 family)
MRAENFLSVDRIEVEANTFAVELLWPDGALDDYEDSNLSLRDIAGIYGVREEFAHLNSSQNVL